MRNPRVLCNIHVHQSWQLALVLVPVYFIKHSVSCYIYYLPNGTPPTDVVRPRTGERSFTLTPSFLSSSKWLSTGCLVLPALPGRRGNHCSVPFTFPSDEDGWIAIFPAISLNGGMTSLPVLAVRLCLKEYYVIIMF